MACCCCPSSKWCFTRWNSIYTCPTPGTGGTGSFSTPTAISTTCISSATYTSWTKVSSDSTTCTYALDTQGKCCTSDGDCSGDPTTPAGPTDGSDCTCPTCTNYCFTRWTCTYDCAAKSFSTPVVDSHLCQATATYNDWTLTTGNTSTEDDTGACTYSIDVQQTGCCTSIGNCTTDGTAPDPPASASACCYTALCDDSCDDCPDSLTLTVSGLSGTGCCASALNGTYHLALDPDNCNYYMTTVVIPGGCQVVSWFVECGTTDCTGHTGAKRWIISGGCGVVMWAERITDSPCLATGTYTTTCCTCDGATPTFSISIP